MSASVKIMLSFDYCHFEICKGTDWETTNEQIDEMRKDCQRLADKAVDQYKIAKRVAELRLSRQEEFRYSQRRIKSIGKIAEGDRTVEEIAELKAFQDKNWEEYLSMNYDYQDGWIDDCS